MNSSATLGHTLKAINEQTYKNIELIVIDSYSSDDTVKIALAHGATVFFAKGLLNQRQLGIRKSKGEYILLLDSDQVLEKAAVEKCMVIEKSVLKPEAIIFNEVSVPMAQGRMANSQAEYVRIIHTGDWDPFLGTALPRFFPAKVLKEIPRASHEIGYFDHAFLYKNVAEGGIGVRFAPDAVIRHYEMNIPLRMLRKFYKYYGFYFIPTLVEDASLAIGRILPRRAILKGAGAGKNVNTTAQIFLYGAKALATSAGVLGYVLSEMFNTIKGAIIRSQNSKGKKI